MAKKKAPVLGTFEGVCQRCSGSGLRRGREDYPCHVCRATGKVQVGVVASGVHSGYLFHVMGKTGPTEFGYLASAELTQPLDRYECGVTVGNGWYEHLLGTDPPGSPCAVYGVMLDGSLCVYLTGGGVGVTGTSTSAIGTITTIAVRILESAAEEAIAALLASDAHAERVRAFNAWREQLNVSEGVL